MEFLPIEFIKQHTHNYSLSNAKILRNNSILFYKLLENIIPKLDDYFLKLKIYLDKSIRIPNRLHKNGKITKKYRIFCTNIQKILALLVMQ